jgi:hypothetical protein
MSTKTTFKRVALVAVAALGFGVLTSVAPANAGASTSSFSVNTSSVTVVTNGTTAAEVTLGAIFKVTLRNVETTAAAHVLQSGETLTVSVVGVPAGTASTPKSVAADAGELTLSKMAPTLNNGAPYSTGQSWNPSGPTPGSIAFGAADTTAYNNNAGNDATTTLANSYYVGVDITGGQDDVIGEGTYTIRLRLTSGNGSLLVQDSLVKVTFVNGAVNSGAILTATAKGSFPAATAQTLYSANQHLKATITDANGGVLIGEDTAGTHNIADLTVDMVDKDGTLVAAATALTEVDDASTSDHGYTATTVGFANAAAANIASSRNGTYGITGTTASFPTAQIGSTNLIRVRYGASSATGAITIINTAPATTGVASVVATGIPVTNVAPNYSLPLTTTAASVVVTGQTPGAAVVFTVTWATTATGNVSPKSATPVVAYADATGTATQALTNSAPVDGAKATVNVTGFGTANPADTVITWTKSTAAEIKVDINGAYVALLATNVATATVIDSFGAPVAGVQLTPAISGSNVSTTRTYAAVTTDAKGQASYTWTDALAVAAGTDTVKFTVLGGTVNGSATITYAATAPAVTAMTNFYNVDPAATSGATTIVTAVPATGIYVNGISTKFAVQVARDNSSPITVAASQDSLKIRVSTGVAGAKIVATGTAGVWFLGSANLAAATRTQYTDDLGNVYFVVGSSTAGANTVTFTSGTVTSSAAFWSSSATTNARFVT